MSLVGKPPGATYIKITIDTEKFAAAMRRGVEAASRLAEVYARRPPSVRRFVTLDSDALSIWENEGGAL